jgi:hypothetical protein
MGAHDPARGARESLGTPPPRPHGGGAAGWVQRHLCLEGVEGGGMSWPGGPGEPTSQTSLTFQLVRTTLPAEIR